MKKIPNRQYTVDISVKAQRPEFADILVLNAVFRYFLGRLASPATIAVYSGPTIVKAADQREPKNP